MRELIDTYKYEGADTGLILEDSDGNFIQEYYPSMEDDEWDEDEFYLVAEEISKEIATALYLGISTDTGCFRYSNTNADTYQVAAVCAQHSKNLFHLNQLLKGLAQLLKTSC